MYALKYIFINVILIVVLGIMKYFTIKSTLSWKAEIVIFEQMTQK